MLQLIIKVGEGDKQSSHEAAGKFSLRGDQQRTADHDRRQQDRGTHRELLVQDGGRGQVSLQKVLVRTERQRPAGPVAAAEHSKYVARSEPG